MEEEEEEEKEDDDNYVFLKQSSRNVFFLSITIDIGQSFLI